MLDLRGVPCPLNWARAKVRLETLDRGDELVVLIDDPRAVRDIPRAAEAHGYAVADPEQSSDGWSITIGV